jgi:hypothetical protein
MIFRPVRVIVGHTEFTHLKVVEFGHPKKKLVSRVYRVFRKSGTALVSGPAAENGEQRSSFALLHILQHQHRTQNNRDQHQYY